MLRMNETRLKDTLHNAHPINVNSPERAEYARGVLVGVVGTLMAMEMEFEDAVGIIRNTQKPISDKAIPESWLTDFGIDHTKHAIVRSNNGDIEIDGQGYPLVYDGEREVNRFDLKEYNAFYGEYADEYDILDLGYWHGTDNVYEPPIRE